MMVGDRGDLLAHFNHGNSSLLLDYLMHSFAELIDAGNLARWTWKVSQQGLEPSSH